MARGRDAKLAANWVMGDLFAVLNKRGITIAEAPVSAAALGALIDLIGDATLSGRLAKDVFAAMVETGRGAADLVEERGLRQVTDTGAIDSAVDAVIAANPDKAEQAKTKPGILGWFVGQAMKSTGGKANPQAVSDALKKRLGV